MNYFTSLAVIWTVFSLMICTGIFVMKEYIILMVLIVPFFLTVLLTAVHNDRQV